MFRLIRASRRVFFRKTKKWKIVDGERTVEVRSLDLQYFKKTLGFIWPKA